MISLLQKRIWKVLIKLNILRSCGSAVPTLGIFPREVKTQLHRRLDQGAVLSVTAPTADSLGGCQQSG